MADKIANILLNKMVREQLKETCIPSWHVAKKGGGGALSTKEGNFVILLFSKIC